MLDIDVKIKFKREAMNFCFSSTSKKIVIFGPSGTGKTTLLKTIAGFYPPESGRLIIKGKIFFDSKRKISLPIYKRRVGYLPQESILFPNMTVQKNILYSVTKYKYSSSVLDKMKEVTERLQISDKLNALPCTLSGGQQKRAALARVLMMNPDILLLDEPFSALDVPIRDCLRGIVSEISDEMDIPVMFVCHDIEDSFSSGQELVVINNGKILEYGKIDDVFNYPKSHETAKLLNISNIWKVEKVDNKKCHVKSTISDAGFSINIPGIEGVYSDHYICLKSTHVKFIKDIKSAKPMDKINLFEAYVKGVHSRGHYNRIVLDINGFIIFASAQERLMDVMSISVGNILNISLRPENMIFCKY